MFSHETFQRQMRAVMEALVEAAVMEMRRLLDQCSRCSSCSALHSTCGKSREEENDMTLLEGTQEMTSQFASLMGTLAKGALEKMTLLTMSGDEGTMDGDNSNREGPDVTREEDDDSKPRHFVLIVPVWPEQGEIQEEDAAAEYLNSVASNCTTAKVKVSMSEDVSRPAPKKRGGVKYKTSRKMVKQRAGTMDGDKKREGPDVAQENDDDAGSQPSTDTHELQVAQVEPASELSDEEDVMDTDFTGQELTANTEKSKKTIELIKCPSCEKTFARKCFFVRHLLTHSKPHLCSQCGKRFATNAILVAHSRKHTGEKLFRCSECGTGFAYKSTFNRHMHQHECKKTQLGTQTCPFCEAEFSGKVEFQRHKCSALETTFRCSLCPMTFECRQSLADHENLHSGERDYVCEVCGERFFSSSSLSTHRVTHIQQDHLRKRTEKKLFTCDVCGKVCSHQSALNHHMLTHTGERPYVCATCGKRCAHASALQNHLRIHTGQKPGQRPVCNVCGKTLSSMTKLKFHMSVHTGDKPYSCDQCAKQFRNPSNLNKHRMTHTGEKLYGCNICGRRFTAASSLRGHRLLHTGERPYRCPICGKKYHQLGEFKKHQKVHVPPQSDEV